MYSVPESSFIKNTQSKKEEGYLSRPCAHNFVNKPGRARHFAIFWKGHAAWLESHVFPAHCWWWLTRGDGLDWIHLVVLDERGGRHARLCTCIRMYTACRRFILCLLRPESMSSSIWVLCCCTKLSRSGVFMLVLCHASCHAGSD